MYPVSARVRTHTPSLHPNARACDAVCIQRPTQTPQLHQSPSRPPHFGPQDKFQRLHTLHNLAQVLASPASASAPSIPRTLRDGDLAADAAAIRTQYLAQRAAKLAQEEVRSAWTQYALH